MSPDNDTMNAILAIKMEGLKKNELDDLAAVLKDMDESMTNIEKPENINKLKEAYEVFTGKKTSFSTTTQTEDKKPATKADIATSNNNLKKQMEKDDDDLQETQEEIKYAQEELTKNQNKSTDQIIRGMDDIINQIHLAVFSVPTPTMVPIAKMAALINLFENKEGFTEKAINKSTALVTKDPAQLKIILKEVFGVKEGEPMTLNVLKEKITESIELLMSQGLYAMMTHNEKALNKIALVLKDIEYRGARSDNLRDLMDIFSERAAIATHFIGEANEMGWLGKNEGDVETKGAGIIIARDISKITEGLHFNEKGEPIKPEDIVHFKQWSEVIEYAKTNLNLKEATEPISLTKYTKLNIPPLMRNEKGELEKNVKEQEDSIREFIQQDLSKGVVREKEFGVTPLYWKIFLEEIDKKLGGKGELQKEFFGKGTKTYHLLEKSGKETVKIDEFLKRIKGYKTWEAQLGFEKPYDWLTYLSPQFFYNLARADKPAQFEEKLKDLVKRNTALDEPGKEHLLDVLRKELITPAGINIARDPIGLARMYQHGLIIPEQAKTSMKEYKKAIEQLAGVSGYFQFVGKKFPESLKNIPKSSFLQHGQIETEDLIEISNAIREGGGLKAAGSVFKEYTGGLKPGEEFNLTAFDKMINENKLLKAIFALIMKSLGLKEKPKDLNKDVKVDEDEEEMIEP